MVRVAGTRRLSLALAQADVALLYTSAATADVLLDFILYQSVKYGFTVAFISLSMHILLTFFSSSLSKVKYYAFWEGCPKYSIKVWSFVKRGWGEEGQRGV